MRFNFFYLVVLLLGASIFFFFRPPAEEDLSFYGFAESNETTINYNYPVVIDSILVRPGEAVGSGESLLFVSRRKAKETLADQEYRIAQLRAEEDLWRQRKVNELEQLQQRNEDDLAEIGASLVSLREELAYKRSLGDGLTSISDSSSDYKPLEIKISNQESERARLSSRAKLKEQSLRDEIRLGNNPFREQIRRLEAELEFEEAQKVQAFVVSAPADGIVGNVEVREEEHVTSYATLLTFYEPHSSLVRGYVHEDLTAKVAIGDALEVYSLREEGRTYSGKVIGLGSRIVETPTRLRKLPEFKTYGREVVIEITPDNHFLQKEKVGIRRQFEN